MSFFTKLRLKNLEDITPNFQFKNFLKKKKLSWKQIKWDGEYKKYLSVIQTHIYDSAILIPSISEFEFNFYFIQNGFALKFTPHPESLLPFHKFVLCSVFLHRYLHHHNCAG